MEETFRAPYLWSLMTSDVSLTNTFEEEAMKVLSQTVGLSMSEAPIAVRPDTPVSEAARVMLDAKVKRLPVVAPREGDKPGMTVVGIISRADVLRHVHTLMRSATKDVKVEQEKGAREEEGEALGSQSGGGGSQKAAVVSQEGA